jgi:hypothetical protein
MELMERVAKMTAKNYTENIKLQSKSNSGK